MLTSSNLAVLYPVIFGASIFAIAYLTNLIRETAARKDVQGSNLANTISVGLALWFCVALAVGMFIELNFPILGMMIATPLVIGSFTIFSPSVSNILASIPLHKLVALSFYRVVGFLFIYLYYDNGSLSQGFAMNAGWGDVITGVSALLVAYLIWKRASYAHWALVAWTIFGVADLIVAPASAYIYGAAALVEFPLNMVPIFLGPPFGILLHLITLRAYWLQNRLSA